MYKYRLVYNARKCFYVQIAPLCRYTESEDETVNNQEDRESAAARIADISDKELIMESGKMVFLVELLDNLKASGHRCLVFSQSRKVLDIIQKVVQNRVSYCCNTWCSLYMDACLH